METTTIGDAMAIKAVIPLPDNDFDTTEVSIPWKHFVGAGFEVSFSTETGKVAQNDPLCWLLGTSVLRNRRVFRTDVPSSQHNA